MNKKIEELAKQAGMVKYPTGLGTDSENTIWGDRNISKFAELIVEECVNLNNQELSFVAFERLYNLYREQLGIK